MEMQDKENTSDSGGHGLITDQWTFPKSTVVAVLIIPLVVACLPAAIICAVVEWVTDSIKKKIIRLAILAILLACTGCVTAPNSNLAVNLNLFGSFSRLGQALGGTNTQLRGEFAGGGSLTATAPMSP